MAYKHVFINTSYDIESKDHLDIVEPQIECQLWTNYYLRWAKWVFFNLSDNKIVEGTLGVYSKIKRKKISCEGSLLRRSRKFTRKSIFNKFQTKFIRFTTNSNDTRTSSLTFSRSEKSLSGSTTSDFQYDDEENTSTKKSVTKKKKLVIRSSREIKHSKSPRNSKDSKSNSIDIIEENQEENNLEKSQSSDSIVIVDGEKKRKKRTLKIRIVQMIVKMIPKIIFHKVEEISLLKEDKLKIMAVHMN